MFTNKNTYLSLFFITLFTTIGFPGLASANIAQRKSANINNHQISLRGVKKNIGQPDITSNYSSADQLSVAKDDFQRYTISNTSYQNYIALNFVNKNKQNSNSKLKLVRVLAWSFFLLLFIPFGIFYPFFLFYKAILGVDEPNSDPEILASYHPRLPIPDEHQDDNFESEKDDFAATVSKLQIAFSPKAEKLRQKLSQFNSNLNLNSKHEIIELMRRTLKLLISPEYWTHVSHSSISLPLEDIETEFEFVSSTERNKFAIKEFSLWDHNQQEAESDNYHQELHQQNSFHYIVITLILCTAHNHTLFKPIYTKEQLKKELINLSKMEKDFLLKFELLCNPQNNHEYLTNEQLLLKYEDLIRLF